MPLRGVFSGGHIVVSDPSAFRDGDVVEILPVAARPTRSKRSLGGKKPVPGTTEYVASLLAGAGAWSKRKDIGESAEYARLLRDQSPRGQ
jgi:hypothetical protein